MIRRLWHWIWASSVRRQLIFGVAAVHMLLMTIFVFDLVHRQREFLTERAKSLVLRQAQLVAASSIQGAMSNDLGGLSEVLAVIGKDNGVSRAMVTDSRGRVLADMRGANVGLFRNDKRTLDVLSGAPQTLLVDENVRSIEAAAPIVAQGRVVGWAWVARNLGAEQAHLAYVTHAGLIYTLAAILIGTIFAFLLAGRVTRQIRLLLAGTDRMAANRLDEDVPVTTSNEVGQVTQAFNAAMHQLSAQQKDLQQSEQRWATTLSSIGDAVIATDVEGKIMFMNAVAEGLTGWTLEEAAAKPVTEIFNIINEQTRGQVENPVAKVLREGMIVGLANHTVLMKKDGSEVPIDDSGAPIRDKDGNTTGVVLVFRDITERKRAEKTLRESERRYSALFANKINGMAHCRVITDEHGRPVDYWIMEINEAYEQIIGIKKADIEGRRATEVFPDIKQYAFDYIGVYGKIALEGGEIKFEEYFEATGQYLSIYAYSPLPGEFAAIFMDVTERKEMEEKLRRSHDELELRVQERTEAVRRQADLLELAHSAIFVHDLEGRISFWNARAEEIYGWTKAEALGNVTDTLLRTVFPVSFDDYMATLTKEGRWEGDSVHTTKDGRQITVLSRHALQRDEAGNPTAIMEINLDVTEARLTEQQLRQAQKMEALGTLTGGVAHDFNNILAAIIGFTELVADHVPKESREAHHLKRVMESSLRGRDLVRQMLTYARKAEQEKKPLSLSTIVKEAVKLVRATTPTTITIKVDAPSESGLILADPTQIQQVIINLCTNAAHAMRANGGTLDIQVNNHSVSPSNGNPDGIKPGLYTRLTVRDTGAGMSPDIMDKIFDPFFTTKKLGEGTGLGLSVVHGIVKQSNGHITVESEPGRGSTFTVYLPQISGELEADAVSNDEIPTGSERILFVDDEEMLVEMGEDILAELGYEVTSRMSSRGALSLFTLDPSRFDLVITDQTMPEMTGVELAKEVLALRGDMPIIMCTGFSYAVDANKAEAAGIRAFAMKPLTKREIARTIRKVLDE